MDEERKRTWDAWVGLLAPLLTVAGIIIGVLQFNSGQERQRRQEFSSACIKDDVEFRRRLWLERLTTYQKVAELAGTIASAPDAKARAKAVSDFRAAYWGAMFLVEDTPVEQAMVDFELELRDFEKGIATDPDRLKDRAAKLGRALRSSLQDGSSRKLAAGAPGAC